MRRDSQIANFFLSSVDTQSFICLIGLLNTPGFLGLFGTHSVSSLLLFARNSVTILCRFTRRLCHACFSVDQTFIELLSVSTWGKTRPIIQLLFLRILLLQLQGLLLLLSLLLRGQLTEFTAKLNFPLCLPHCHFPLESRFKL